MNKLRGEKAITLVALIVTIIILLILAGVSISALSGQNGILTKAGEAKSKTELAKIEEARKLTQIEAATNIEGTTYEGVKIPSGFAVSQVEGENLIDNGLVIIDSKGNEFVWIPCTEEDYKDRESDWANSGMDKTWSDTQSTGTGLTSVKANGGFYIGRYEAGIPENAINIYANSNGATYITSRNTTEYTPVSKQNVQAWNFISQTNAKTVSQNMIPGTSYLVDSYAWNAVCRKIESKYGTEKDIIDSKKWGNYHNNTTTAYNKLNTLFAVHSKVDANWKDAETYQKGLVTGAPDISNKKYLELATGASQDFKAYNVYDIAGNM